MRMHCICAPNRRCTACPSTLPADGNTVEIGVEQAAFSQNATDFQTSLTFVNMKLRGLAKAINGQ
jgi:flagellar basal-body rod protein FlgB